MAEQVEAQDGVMPEENNVVSPEADAHPSRFMETMGSRYSLLGLHPDCDGLTLDFTFGPERNGYSKMSVTVRKTEVVGHNRNDNKNSTCRPFPDDMNEPGVVKNNYKGSTVNHTMGDVNQSQGKWPFTTGGTNEPTPCQPPQLSAQTDSRFYKAPSTPQTEGSVAAKENRMRHGPKKSRSTIEEDWDPFSEFDYKLPSKLKEASRNVKSTNEREKNSQPSESLMNYAPASQTNVESKANLSVKYGAGPGRILSRSMSQPHQLASSAHPESHLTAPEDGENGEGNHIHSKSMGWMPLAQYPVRRKWQSSFANINMDSVSIPQKLTGNQAKGYSFCSDAQTEGNDQSRQSQSDQPSRSKNTKSKRKRLWRAAGGTSHEIIQFHEVMRKQTREWVVSSPQHANFKSFEDANPAVCQALRQRLQAQFPSCYDEELVNSLLVLKYRNSRRSNQALCLVGPPEDAESNH